MKTKTGTLSRFVNQFLLATAATLATTQAFSGPAHGDKAATVATICIAHKLLRPSP
jgi:hypothetical protein